jgi:hypothetical protein
MGGLRALAFVIGRALCFLLKRWVCIVFGPLLRFPDATTRIER